MNDIRGAIYYAEHIANQKHKNESVGNKPKDATPEEVVEWRETDFFSKGDFDVMKLFVVIPAVVQVVMFSFMLGVFYINNLFI